MALQGDLTTLSVRDLFNWLSERSASGSLSLSQRMIARRFYLRQGWVTLGSSSEEETLLGRLLIARGLIDEGQLAAALDQPRGTGVRLGHTLVETGLLSAATLSAVMIEKVEGLLRDALGWSEGTFYFDDAVSPEKHGLHATGVELRTLVGTGEPLRVTDSDVLESVDLPRRKATPRASNPTPRQRNRASSRP